MKNTFSFISAHLRPSAPQSSRGPVGRRRGFTLLELMVVVLIITLTSVMAIPGITRKIKESRSKEAIERFAAIYRNARLRAMGRGSAVVVRYSNAGTIQVLERVQGASNSAAGCQTMPVSSCLSRADFNSSSIVLDEYELTYTGDHTISVEFVHPNTAADTTATNLDVCFTPTGRTYTNMVDPNLFEQMKTAPKMTLERVDGVGIDRMALITPNGSARVVGLVQ